jgi:site-specific DNA-methyltransferase (adenine-specific)
VRVLNDHTEENVPLDSLFDYPGNPNEGDTGAVSESLDASGFYGAIVADVESRKILAGHTRKRALLAEGETHAPLVVWVRTDDPDHARRVLLADNRTNRVGYDDPVRLIAMLEEQAATAEGLRGTGWDADDLDAIIAEQQAVLDGMGGGREELAPDEAPEPPVTPVTRLGDVWVLGDHRLLCGDARRAADYVLLLGEERASLVWTDPPYGVEYGEKNRFLQTIGPADRLEEDIAGDSRDPEALRALLAPTFDCVLAASVPGAVWFVAAPPGPPLSVFAAELRRIDVWRQLLCWVKNRPIFGRSDYHYQHENLFYGWSPGAAHQPPPTHSTSSLWEFDSPAASKLHPTMKPVGLIAQAVRDHSVLGGLVLDPFAGSGTTLVACEQEGRRARVMEIDPAYCDVICRRFQEYTDVVPVLEATGEEHDFCAPVEATTS